MSITPPPVAPSLSDPATFPSRADAFVAWLVSAVPQFNSLAVGSTASGTFTALVLDTNITHQGDTNTYIGFPSNDTVEIRANGLTALQAAGGGASPAVELWSGSNVAGGHSFLNNGFTAHYSNSSDGAGGAFGIKSNWSVVGRTQFIVANNGNAININNSYGAISDISLKENIVSATPKLAELMQVEVRNFNRIGDTQKQIGVIAQELELIWPGLVETSADGIKSVKYSVFVPILIKSLQEAVDRIAALEAAI